MNTAILEESRTIDVERVKKILDNCPNYDKIINFEYKEGDVLSYKLVEWYKELIFSANASDENQLRIISEIDKSLYLYVNDRKYAKGLKKIISAEEVSLEDQGLIRTVIKKIIYFTNCYEKKEILNVRNTKWL